MLTEFTDRFIACKEQTLRELQQMQTPVTYKDLVCMAIKCIHIGTGDPDPKQIYEIRDSDAFHGTCVYVIPEEQFRRYRYWYVMIEYGSCTTCDTLQRLERYEKDPLARAHGYWTMMLHIVQGLSEMQAAPAFFNPEDDT